MSETRTGFVVTVPREFWAVADDSLYEFCVWRDRRRGELHVMGEGLTERDVWDLLGQRSARLVARALVMPGECATREGEDWEDVTSDE